MSAYRYVVFPRGKQPTAEEARQLDQFASLLANHFAWGVARDDGRLALAAELRTFDHAREIDAGFAALVHAWELHGCELVDHLKFVKDPAALRPTSNVARPGPIVRAPAPAPHDKQPSHAAAGAGDALHNEARLAAKHMIAHEATAKAVLGLDRRLQRFATLQRFAAAGPYALIALGAAATIGAGLYIRHRVFDADRERRQETIERMLEEPAGEAANEAQDE